jgi:hypothetical protein
MPDITMCIGVKVSPDTVHPHCTDCYRRTATPKPVWQSYFASPPLKVVHDGYLCDYYESDLYEA